MLDRIFDLAKINTTINGFSDNMKKLYYDYLINEFGVLFTYHSNRIEGANTTLTLSDTKNILNETYDFGSIVDKNKQREVNETINHQNAFKFIFDVVNKDMDILEIIKGLHQIVGSGVINGAGSYKERKNYMVISSGKEIDFIKPGLVSEQMDKLREIYNNEWQELTVFERAANIHMAITNIHPFSDGNGRVARLILNYELIKNNYPPININESQKLSYYSVLEEININTDYEKSPLEFGDIKTFNETIQQLSIVTFMNMQKYLKEKYNK